MPSPESGRQCPAFYFGIACGRELRFVLAGERTRAEALRRYGSFSDSHGWKYRSMLYAQRIVPRVPPRALQGVMSTMQRRRLVDWSFGHYLRIAPPEFAAARPVPPARGRVAQAAA